MFTPKNLLGEVKRQKQLPSLDVPEVCVLDPDGEVATHALCWCSVSTRSCFPVGVAAGSDNSTERPPNGDF